MKLITHGKIKGLGLAGLSLVAVFAFGLVGSASATSLLFISNKLPYHLAGTGGATLLETAGFFKGKVESKKVDVLVVILTSTLADVHLRFLETKSPSLGGAKCSNVASEAETVLVNLIAHLGLAHPGNLPAVLMLVPSGFKFECGGTKVEVAGSVIGKITSPALKTASELMNFSFKQKEGKQEFTTFLLGNEVLSNRHEESSLGFGFEESGQEGEATLHALPGQGAFLLISP